MRRNPVPEPARNIERECRAGIGQIGDCPLARSFARSLSVCRSRVEYSILLRLPGL